MAAYEDLKSATEGWYCRPLPAPMVTGVLPRGELEPFLELTSDIGANENPLVHYIDFITGHRDPVPPELDEQYKAAWKDDNYHNLPPPFGFKTAPPHHMTLQICIFDAPDGTKTIIKHCVIPNKAKTAVFASMAFGSVKKLCFQHPKVHDRGNKRGGEGAAAWFLQFSRFPGNRQPGAVAAAPSSLLFCFSIAPPGGGQGLAIRFRAVWRQTVSGFLLIARRQDGLQG